MDPVTVFSVLLPLYPFIQLCPLSQLLSHLAAKRQRLGAAHTPKEQPIFSK